MNAERYRASLRTLVGAAALSAACSQSCARGTPPVQKEVDCIGRPDARYAAVYLHGMDTPEPSEQERSIREELRRIAADLDLRIALPRAGAPCPDRPEMRCWGWRFDRTEVVRALAAADTAAGRCFSPKTPYGLIGFSNGGAAVNKLVQLCLPHSARWHVSIASAGNWSDSDPKDLRTCGAVRMLVGRADEPTLAPAREYAAHVRSLGADVDLLVFDGGHELPLRETKSAIANFVTGAAGSP